MTRRTYAFLGAVCAASILFSWAVAASQGPVVVVFYREGCEDCERMMPVIQDLEAQYPDLGFRYIKDSDPDASLMWTLAIKYGVVPSQFPVIFVGKTAMVGASLANELLLRSAVQACASSSCSSPLDSIVPSTIPWGTILLVGLVLLVLGIVFLA